MGGGWAAAGRVVLGGSANANSEEQGQPDVVGVGEVLRLIGSIPAKQAVGTVTPQLLVPCSRERAREECLGGA